MPRHNIQSLSLFLAKIALYVRYGYTRYAIRQIPEGKDLIATDFKIVRAYEITFSRPKRSKRKKQGLANVMYLRYKNTFILLATEGEHETFNNIDSIDLKQHPIIFSGYTVFIKNHKPCVQISKRRFKVVKKITIEMTLHNHGKVTRWLRSITPFNRFKGINQQRWKLYKQVNKKRKAAGLTKINWQEVKP